MKGGVWLSPERFTLSPPDAKGASGAWREKRFDLLRHLGNILLPVV